MGIKINKILVLFFVLIGLAILPMQTNAAEPENVVRVGITDNNFQNVLKKELTVFATADCEICDKESRKVLIRIPANTDIVITNEISGLNVAWNDNSTILHDFVIVSQTGLLGVRGLKRKSKQALYHGAFEFAQAKDRNGFYLINLVEIQDYLKGVVPNEMPVRFGLEALKAQAVAARNYVLTPRTQAYDEFNVVDSVSSQVYYGVNTESDISTRAVMETDGIIALYNNEPILTLYSSTAGGYTESYSYAFSDPTTKLFPSLNKPYLIATPDKDEFPTLETEEKAKEFYKSKVPSFDIESPYYRWEKSWAVGELENILKKTLVAQSKTGFISPVFRENDELGKIKDIKVMKRGKSGKIIELDLMTTRGCYRIAKELVIRRVFQKDDISLPSANVIFEKTLDKNGNITDIKAYGGGYGHGVGMSQFGAGYMAVKLHQPYYNILRHYYNGISLGTKPVIVKNSPVKQTFWSPVGRAAVIIVGQNIPKLAITINGKNYLLETEHGMFQKDSRVDISRYIEDGANSIIFHPSCYPIKMYIEVVEKYNLNNLNAKSGSEE